MKTVSIQRYTQLSPDQWRRIAETAKRHVRERTGQSCEIGVGPKYRDGKPIGPRAAIRVYLPSKRKRVAQSIRIPDHLELRLRQTDGTYNLIRAVTDVVSLRDFVPTRAKVHFGSRTAATGLMISWNESGDETTWGFISVDHLFDHTSRRSLTVRVNSRTRFRCRHVASAPRNKHLDAAVFRIVGRRSDIERQIRSVGRLSTGRSSATLVMTSDQVMRAATKQASGRTDSPFGLRRFVAEEVFPNGFQLGSRRLDDCIRVGRARGQTFKEGTSGSVWSFDTQVGCLQVGGKADAFDQGIGQPIACVMDWARSELGPATRIVAVINSTD